MTLKQGRRSRVTRTACGEKMQREKRGNRKGGGGGHRGNKKGKVGMGGGDSVDVVGEDREQGTERTWSDTWEEGRRVP